MKNYVGHSLGLSALVLAFLLILSALSEETTLWGFAIRKMDILSDIRSKTPETAPEIDTLAALPVDSLSVDIPPDTLPNLPRPEVDSALFGQIFEDYTFQDAGLSAFFAAVDSIATHRRTVRVAFFGDSFVEGDIMLGDLRDTLQTVWGGAGVGFVPVSSEISRFRRTYLQDFKGWKSYSIIHNEGATVPLGLNGHVYIPEPEAKMHFKGTRQYAFRNTGAWGEVRIFYRAEQGLRFYWQTEGNGPVEAALPATTRMVSEWTHREPNISAFAARFPQTDGLALYGAALESGPGIYFDNFSVRGNSGGRLCLIQPEMMRAFDQYRRYDLIILQFGLNAVTNSLRNIRWYEAELEKTYAHIRKSFPHTPVLVVSVPDRGGKVDGALRTMISVPHIVQMQRNLARKHGFMFFDFFKSMGGEGAMVRLSAASRPTLVNKDYTHLTHEGGRMMGLQMGALFLAEKERLRQR